MLDRRVIIVGGDHHNTLGVIWAMREAGVRPYVIILSEEASPFVPVSRYLAGSVVIQKMEELLPAVINLSKDQPQKPVVICCHDEMAALIDQSSETLSEYAVVPCGTRPGSLLEWMDKEKMGALAVSCGLDVPASGGFPCIVKPKRSLSGSKDWIKVCRDADQLNECLDLYGAEKLQVQQFIEKTAEFQLIGCALPDGTVLIPGVSSILRPCKGSNTAFLKYSGPETQVDADKVKAFVRATGYCGLFSVEFVRGRDGRDYFLEMNFRNDGNAICVTRAGVNLPLIWCLGASGLDYEAAASASVRTVYVMPEFEELTLLSSRSISIGDFLKDLLLRNAGMDFYFWDQCPFWHQLFRRIKKKIVRKQ